MELVALQQEILYGGLTVFGCFILVVVLLVWLFKRTRHLPGEQYCTCGFTVCRSEGNDWDAQSEQIEIEEDARPIHSTTL
jgi:hypothetical protein